MSGLRRFLRNQFLPLGLVAAAILGLACPSPGRFMAALPTQHVAVSVIFLCSGLLLRTDEVRAALTAWRATLWGALVILLITPVIGTLIAFRLPLAPPYQLGLALFCCMPTTLSSGIALTGQARGNVALAVLLTALTNLVGIFTVPFLLTVLVGAFGEVELSAGELLGQLILSILLPLAAGKGLRHLLVPWIERRRYGIGLVSNVALISVPWMKFSQSSESLAGMAVAVLAGIILAGLLIHGLYLAFNLVTTRMLGFPPPIRKAVVFLASQKTLPVALTVLAFLPVPETVKGLVAIPCVTSHLSQIFVDAVIATRWGQFGSGSDSA